MVAVNSLSFGSLPHLTYWDPMRLRAIRNFKFIVLGFSSRAMRPRGRASPITFTRGASNNKNDPDECIQLVVLFLLLLQSLCFQQSSAVKLKKKVGEVGTSSFLPTCSTHSGFTTINLGLTCFGFCCNLEAFTNKARTVRSR